MRFLIVSAELFHLIEPDVACFGRKDIQQLTLLRQMVRDLNWALDLAVTPTVREPDGLALSSRNGYLTPDQRPRATALYAALGAALDLWRGGETRAAQLEARMRATLAAHAAVAVEYIAIAEPTALAPVDRVDGSTVVALAARIGSVRLIDNVILGEGLP